MNSSYMVSGSSPMRQIKPKLIEKKKTDRVRDRVEENNGTVGMHSVTP